MVLPPRPLRLQSSFVWKFQLGGLALLLGALAVAVAVVLWQAAAVRALLDQNGIWAAGQEAAGASAGGEVTTHLGILHSYTLHVKYLDGQGAEHAGVLEFDALFASVDRDKDPVVRFLADAPERFALSWAQDLGTSRWAAAGVWVLLGAGLIGGAIGAGGWFVLRRLGDARRCARQADEYVARITSVVPQYVKGRHSGNAYLFAAQTVDGRPITGKADFPLAHTPLFADREGTSMLVLAAQDCLQRPVAPRDDFFPFALTAEEQAAARAALGQTAG